MPATPKKKRSPCAHRLAREAARAPDAALPAEPLYPVAEDLSADEWDRVRRALRRMSKSSALAALMALSGAMFGGCMPAVRHAPPPPYQQQPPEPEAPK